LEARRQNSGWLVVLACVVGCRDAAKSAPPATAGRDAPAAVATSDASANPRCAAACLYLQDLPIEDARTAFERDCGSAWPYAADDCEGLKFARECIFAAHGVVFDDPAWRTRFEREAWYHPRPGVGRDLASIAPEVRTISHANHQTLGFAIDGCGRPRLPRVSDADRRLTEAWYVRLVVDGERPRGVDVTGIEELENHVIDDATRFAYADPPTPDRRAIEVTNLYHAVGPGESDPSSRIVLVFDASNRLIEIR
jgi:hypothetical protein